MHINSQFFKLYRKIELLPSSRLFQLVVGVIVVSCIAGVVFGTAGKMARATYLQHAAERQGREQIKHFESLLFQQETSGRFASGQY